MADSRRQVVIAVDQGTSATKAILVDGEGRVVARTSRPLRQAHPRPGWVEQDPDEIFNGVAAVVDELKAAAESPIAAIGFSTQRESALAWDPTSGRVLSPVLGWQDRRSTAIARSLAAEGRRVRALSGLPLDPMFSALKLSWILDEIDQGRERAAEGRIALGTVDSWLMHRATGEHRIEIGNASRTQLLDVAAGDWSEELLALFRIPRRAMPRVMASDAPAEAFGIAVGAVLGDSHAALYGHGVRAAGDVKVTYGSGSSVMGLTDGPAAGPGLVETIGWRIGGTTARAFEGNILSTGATVSWLAGVLGITTDELADLAASSDDTGGIDLVPAFAGLGAPWWDESAVGVVAGLQLGTTRRHLARAAFESIANQIEDVLSAAEAEIGTTPTRILADGGPSRNAWLMQLQADVSGRQVRRHDGADLSALGAAMLAATTVGVSDDASVGGASHTTFSPRDGAERERIRADWAASVARARLRPNGD